MADLQSRFWSSRVSRRRLLRGGLVVGAGLAGAALIGCGEGEPTGGGTAPAGGTTAPGGSPTAAATSPPAGAAKPGGTLRVALPGGPTLDSLDMNRTTGTWTHLEGLTIFDTLTVEDPDKELVGSLAESWEEAEDSLSAVLQLRKGVTFHDGTEFTSEHVKFLLDRVSDPDNTRALAKSYLGPSYTSTDVVDEHTAKINLNAPNFTMLRRFTRAYFGVPSMVAVDAMGLDGFARQPVGSGPWSFDEWVQDNRVSVKKFEDYNWAPPIFAHQGPAYLDGISFIEIPDQESRANAIESGDVDVMEEVPPVAVDRFKDDDRFKTFSARPQGEGYHIRINSQVDPTNDARVRQAIEHAIDRQEIIDLVYFGVHELSYSPLSSSAYGWDPALKDRYPYEFDPKKAAELLDAAGWTMGAGGAREKGGQPLRLTYFSNFKDVAELVQVQLREVGIDVAIDIVAPGTESQDRAFGARDHFTDGGTQQAGFLNEDSDILRVIYAPSQIGSQSNATFMGYQDDHLADVLTKQQQVPRGEERIALLQEAQQIIVNAAIIVPVFDPVKYLIAKKDVEDIKMWPVNFYSFFYDTYFS
jgi:peptide/nickel transport system substrate-binding protein